MEMKQNISLEVEKGGYTFVLYMPTGASYGNAIDASFEMLQKLSELAQQSAQNFKPAEPSVSEEA